MKRTLNCRPVWLSGPRIGALTPGAGGGVWVARLGCSHPLAGSWFPSAETTSPLCVRHCDSLGRSKCKDIQNCPSERAMWCSSGGCVERSQYICFLISHQISAGLSYKMLLVYIPNLNLTLMWNFIFRNGTWINSVLWFLYTACDDCLQYFLAILLIVLAFCCLTCFQLFRHDRRKFVLFELR